MYRAFLRDPKFIRFLAACDEEMAEEARRAGCPYCGGRLHRANYPRKPRGVPEEVAEETVLRRSYCCDRCRRRTTPASLLFLGRRVYCSVAVIVAGAMRGARKGAAWKALIRTPGGQCADPAPVASLVADDLRCQRVLARDQGVASPTDGRR